MPSVNDNIQETTSNIVNLTDILSGLLASILAQLEANGMASLQLQRGTSFPTSPSQYDLFQRTDLGVICEYDGARWLGPPHEIHFPIWSNGVAPYSASGTIFSFPLRSSFVVQSLLYGVQVNTTNNGSNYWSLAFTIDNTTVNTLTTAAMSVSTYAILQWAPSPQTTYTPTQYIRIAATKVGAPGPLYISNSLRIRRVYT